MVKKVTTRSDKPDDLVEGLDDATPIGGHKGWWNSFLGDGDKLDELKFGNKMVLLMDVLKESALIGDKVTCRDHRQYSILCRNCRLCIQL